MRITVSNLFPDDETCTKNYICILYLSGEKMSSEKVAKNYVFYKYLNFF